MSEDTRYSGSLGTPEGLTQAKGPGSTFARWWNCIAALPPYHPPIFPSTYPALLAAAHHLEDSIVCVRKGGGVERERGREGELNY